MANIAAHSRRTTHSRRTAFIRPLMLALMAGAAIAVSGCVDESKSSSGNSGNSNPVESQPSGNAQVVLNWTAPTERENGDPLGMTFIDGFEVHYGRTKGEYTEIIRTDHASETQVEINGLSAGQWHFAVRTLDTDGRLSRFSDVKSIHLN